MVLCLPAHLTPASQHRSQLPISFMLSTAHASAQNLALYVGMAPDVSIGAPLEVVLKNEYAHSGQLAIGTSVRGESNDLSS